MTRIEEEFLLLREEYPNATLSPQRDWIEIPDFAFPPLYNRAEGRLRIPISSAYPDAAPDNFFVTPGLKVLKGNRPPNSYSDGVRRWGESWGQFSWHAQKGGWRPSVEIRRGDNLLTFLTSVRQRLQEGV